MASGYRLLKLLHCLPPETAHHLGLFALRYRLLPAQTADNDPALAVNVFGLSFSNPIGLAAGFDKNAVAVDGVLAQGFGFIEAGTVTPLAQDGNPKPRIFRLREDAAVINRLGFNNDGLASFVENLKTRRRNGIVGANIGKNRDGDALADYTACLKAVYPYADYIAVNISSPNTQGLRDLQKRGALAELLTALSAARAACAVTHKKTVPLLLKIAPDLDQREKEDIAELALAKEISGLIVSNTSLSRPDSLKGLHKNEQGGLSGRPLFALSTATLSDMYRLTHGRIPLVGVGGIASAEDAYGKIRAGASLVQLYTALVYQGFGVVRDIRVGLPALLSRDGFTHISQAVGKDAA